jgi:argininosuccinate lyase
MSEHAMSSQVSRFPAAIYRDTVLTPLFVHAQRLLLSSMLEIDAAHLVMLAGAGILTRGVAKACLKALRSLDRDALQATDYDGTVEDLFFLVEKRIAAICGKEAAGRIHTARSRNDLNVTMYRMVLRFRLLGTLEANSVLRGRLIALASAHRDALMPAYTHNQPAQPTTLGHYLMAAVEFLERDARRLRAAFLDANRSPLGACAITTTGFPIDRELTARLLGFDGLQVNSYGAIAAIDYVAESCSAVAVSMLNLGRLVQDLLLWSTAEFNYLHLSCGYVQISSIMPQKRNPVPLEHVRIMASRSMFGAQAILQALHNTPFADMNDSEDPLQPMVERVFNDGIHAMRLLEGVLSEATFHVEHMRQRAGEDFLTATELADTLVRNTGISFHRAHAIVSESIRTMAGGFDKERMVALVAEKLKAHAISGVSEEQLRTALDPQNFVKIRTIVGGPAPEPLSAELERAEDQLTHDRLWIDQRRARIGDAHSQLEAAVSAIVE